VPLDSADTKSWPSLFPKAPVPAVFFSALGTTKAQAGSLAAQREVEVDLSLALAKAAEAAGVQVYVLISSQMASAESMFPYTRMKGEFEELAMEIGFPHVVVLRPGLIVGTRDDSRPLEYVLRVVARGLGAVTGGALKDSWAQDAGVIARAAVRAGLECVGGKREGKERIWVLEQADIIKLGKPEWEGQGEES